MKFCKDCNNAIFNADYEKARTGSSIHYARCKVGPSHTNMVSGEVSYPLCSDMRQAQACGHEALLFEAREVVA